MAKAARAGKQPAQTQSAEARPAPAQLLMEKILRVYLAAFGLFHIFLSVFRYYGDLDASGLRTADYLLGAGLLLLLAGYCALTCLRYPQTLGRLRRYARGYFRREDALLWGLGLWYLLCCQVVGNEQQGPWLTYNLWPLYDFALTAIVFFGMARLLRDARGRALGILINALLLLLGACAAYVYYVLATTQAAAVGISAIFMRNGRLCVCSNPNTTGTYAALLVMLSVYMAFSAKKAALRPLYALSALAHFGLMALSNSMASLLGLMFGAGFTCMIISWRFLRGRKRWQRYVIGAAVCLAAMALTYYIRLLTYKALAGLLNLTGEGRTVDDVDFTFSSRIYIWIAAVKAMFSSPARFLFGVTPVSVNSMISLMSEGTYNTYTHNEILEVGVALGVPGLLAFAAFLVRMAARSLAIGLDETGRYTLAQRILPIVLLTQVVNNMAEAVLLFYHFMNGAVFFLLAGYVVMLGGERARKPRPALRPPAGKPGNRRGT